MNKPKTPLVQWVVIVASLASALGSMSVLVHSNHHDSKCYNTNHKWNSAVAFASFVFVLFGINMKRVVCGQLAGYQPLGMLQKLDDLAKDPAKWAQAHALRLTGILVHVACLGSLIALAAAGGFKIHCGESSLTAAHTFAIWGFIVNFLVECGVAFLGDDRPKQSAKSIPAAHQHVTAHVVSCMLLLGLAIVAVLRVDEQTSQKAIAGTSPHNCNGNTTPAPAPADLIPCVRPDFDLTALVVVLFLSVVGFVMLFGDYLVTADLQYTSLLSTHKLTYGMVVASALLSTITYAHMESYGISQFDKDQKNHIVSQFALAVSTLVGGPLVGFAFGRGELNVVDSENKKITEIDTSGMRDELHSGMRAGQRLSAAPKKTIELQFV